MNVPTHYGRMTDTELLRDLYAQGYNGDPLMEHVCQRWELLVEEIDELSTDLASMRDAMAEEAVQAEQKQDAMQDEIDELEREASRLEAKAYELQMEVDNLNAQLNG